MQYAVSFLEGIITFISPCLLPMLPLYISLFCRRRGAKHKENVERRIWVCDRIYNGIYGIGSIGRNHWRLLKRISDRSECCFWIDRYFL